MKEFDYYQVDSFADKIFGGNPASICILQEWPSDETLLAIAKENNQAETGYIMRDGDKFNIRYFTTLSEIDLCGHATLAATHVIFHHLKYEKKEIQFATRLAGPLSATRDDDWYRLDFPNWMPEPVAKVPDAALKGLGVAKIAEAYVKRDYLFVFEKEEDIRTVKPDFKSLGQLGRMVCITAPGRNCDFVSRFFCPGEAREEDPVTGSAHSMLTPYWAQRLGKAELNARQLSERGGELKCVLFGDRVHISGRAQTYLQGKIYIPN